jgi:hypothetical protein
VFAGGWLGLRRRGSDTNGEPDMRGRNLSKAANRVLKQMETAARSGDIALFFNSARLGLQRRLGAQWQIAPERITTDEVDTRLGNDGEEIRQIFALADEANYSGRQLTTTDFERWMQVVRQRLSDEAAP